MPRYCGRLVDVKVLGGPAEGKRRVDVCEREAGHGGPHKGRWKGIEWTQDDRRSPPNIISHGGTHVADDRD